MGTQRMIHAAVLHGIGQVPRYEPFPAPVARPGPRASRPPPSGRHVELAPPLFSVTMYQ
jgi:hypothetical protein